MANGEHRPDDISVLWQTAVDDYTRSTGDNLFTVTDPQSCTIDSVLDFTTRSQNTFGKWRNDGGKVSKCRTALKRCLGPLNGLGNLIAPYASAAFPPSTAILAAVSHLIKTANTVSVDFDNLTTFFEDLHRFLDRLKILDGNVPTPPEIQRCLVDILTLILSIIGISTKNMKKGRGLKYLKNLVSGEDQELKDAYARLQILVNQEERLINNQTLVNSAVALRKLDMLPEMDSKIDESLETMKRVEVLIEREAQAKRIADMLTSLDVMDPARIKDQLIAKKDRLLNGTGSWIYKEPSADDESKSLKGDLKDAASIFVLWQTDDMSPILWIKGNAGKGKTMLAISLIEELKSNLERDPNNDLVLGYFFCIDTEENNSAAYILRTLIWQILRQIPGLATHLRREYDTQRKALLSDTVGGLSILQKILDNIISDPEFEGAYVVIDALDECEETTLDAFLNYLNSYINPAISHNRRQAGKIKWLVTSRNEVFISEPLNGTLEISLEDNVEHVNESVSQYVAEKVEDLAKLKKYDVELRTSVESHLLQNANGTFLWVALACKELGDVKVTRFNTKNVLFNLPPGLVPMYYRILGQALIYGDSEIIRSLLQAVLVAFRPLTLFELAVVANLDTKHRLDEKYITDCVLQCGSLLSIQEYSGRINFRQKSSQVSFIHQSAKDYLAPKHCSEPGLCRASKQYLSPMYCSDPGACRCPTKCLTPRNCLRQKQCHCPTKCLIPKNYPINFADSFPLDEVVSHTMMTERCLEYLTGNVYTNTFVETYPLTNYASIFWDEHAKMTPADSIPEGILHELFVTNPKSGKAWCQVRYPPKSTLSDMYYSSTGFQALHCASHLGVIQLVQLLLDTGVAINRKDKSGNTAFLYACGQGHEDIVRLLLDRGADIEAKDKSGGTGLFFAAEYGRAKVVQQLLEKGANSAVKGGYFEHTPLTIAADKGHEAAVRALLKNGADIEARNSIHYTALLDSVYHPKVVRLLLDNGADVEAKAGNGETALFKAATNSCLTSVEMLLQKGANTEARDYFAGSTVLHAAAYKGVGHEERGKVVELLVRHGAKMEAKDKRGMTVLRGAVSERDESREDWILDSVRVLLKRGAKIEAADNKGKTALRAAASRGHKTVARLLLDYGAEVETKDNEKERTSLFVAASHGHEIIVKELLNKGAKVNVQDKNGLTPIMAAASNGHEIIVQELLNKGAKVNMQDKNGLAPIMAAASNSHAGIVGLLLKNGANVDDSLLCTAASKGLNTVVQELLNNESKVDTKDKNGMAPIVVAVCNGHEEVVRLLLDAGAKADEVLENGDGLLSIAASKGYIMIAQDLLKRGAKVDINDKDGMTPIMAAVFNGHEKLIRLLLDEGANANEKFENGDSLLSAAVSKNLKTAVQELLNEGAKVDVKDKDGITPIATAISNSREMIVRLLLEKGAKADEKSENGDSLLSIAASRGLKTVVRELLKKGVDPNTKNKNLETALFIAIGCGHTAVVWQLLSSGDLDIEAKDKDGATALHRAMEGSRDNSLMVKRLLEKGAAVYAKDNNGDTALEVSKKAGKKYMINILEGMGTGMKFRPVNRHAHLSWLHK